MKFRHIMPFVILLMFMSGVAYILHSIIDILRDIDMDVFP